MEMDLDKKTFVLVATPCYGGLLSAEYSRCMTETKSLFSKYGIGLGVAYLTNESLIPRGRNTLMAKFLADPRFTHLLFIDADISWNPVDILKLLMRKKDLIGGCYPKKKINYERIPTLVDEIRRLQTPENPDFNFELLESKMYDYVMNMGENPSLNPEGLLSVRHIGTGFMLISRNCLNKMIEEYGEMTKHNDDHGNLSEGEREYLYALFDTDIENGHYLSEDYTFCKRWIDIGGEVFADLSIKLWHSGTHIFKGNFGMSLLSVDKLIQNSKKKVEENINKKNVLTKENQKQ